MSVRILGRMLVTAVGAGALVGAAQLGVAYGLGIVHFARSFDGGTENQWNAQLAWVGWAATLAAVAGAAAAAGVARRNEYAPGVGSRIVLALFGGIGAGAVAPLSMQPARAAELTRSVDPALVVGLAAGLGAVAGVLIAVAVLSLRPLAWNAAAVAAVVWVAALVAVGLTGFDGPPSGVRLGVPQWTDGPADTDRLAATVGMPALALLAGAVVAAVARIRREPALGAAVNGAAGAAPLALAYLIAGPGQGDGNADQLAPYLGSLIAVPAGVLGSLLITLLVRRPDTRVGSTPQAAAGEPPRPAEPLEPTHIIPPVVSATASVPRRDDEYVGWVSGLGSEARPEARPGDVPPPRPRRAPGEPLPRRNPGQRFPAGA